MRKNKLVLRGIIGSSFLSVIAPIMISSTTSENANVANSSVEQNIANRPKTAIDLWKQEYVNSLKADFTNLINAKRWNDFDGGLTDSQIDFLSKKVESMTFENYNSVRQEILKLGHESKEAFSRLITFTFGGSYFTELMKKPENASINETIKNGFDSLRVFSRADLLEDEEYKTAFEEYKTTADGLFNEIKSGDNLDNAKLVDILTRAKNAYEKFSAVIKSRTDAKFNKLKEFDVYHNYLVNYFYADDKTTVNGNPNEWKDRNFYVGLAGNWSVLIGNLANDEEISNLLFNWTNTSSGNYNHFLAKTGEGEQWQGGGYFLQEQSWLVDNDSSYLFPMYHARTTKGILSNIYNNDVNLAQSDKEKLEVYLNGAKKVEDRYYTNLNGHRYFIENFNFNPEHMPISIYAWRKGAAWKGRPSYTGTFYGKQFTNAGAWKTANIASQNGYFQSNANLVIARDIYAGTNTKEGNIYKVPKNVNGNDKLAALAQKIEEKKRELEELKTSNPELADVIDKWIKDIEAAKELNNVSLIESSLDTKKYISDSIKTGAIGNPAADKLTKYINGENISLLDSVKALSVFDKLNSEASKVVEAIEHYENEVKEDAKLAGFEFSEEADKISEVAAKIEDGKYKLDLPADFSLSNPSQEQVNSLKAKIVEDEEKVKPAIFDISKKTYEKLTNDLIIPQLLKDEHQIKSEGLIYDKENYKNNTKELYNILKENAKDIDKIFRGINNLEKINRVEFDNPTDEQYQKYEEAIQALEQYGKNEALAKKIIEDLTDKNDTFSIKDAYEAYKSAKEAMQPADLLKAKEEAKKAIEEKISKILSASEDVISREQKEALVNELKKLEDNIENASKVKTVLDNLENVKSLYELPVSKVEADKRFDNLIKEVESNSILTADQKTQIINDLKAAKAENSKATTKEAVRTNSESAEAKAREDIKNYEELENARAKAIEEINKYVELIKNDKSVSQRKLDELLKEAEKAIKQLENDKTLAEIKKTRDDFFNNYDIYNQKRPGLVIIALLLALSSVAAIVLLLLLLLDPKKK